VHSTANTTPPNTQGRWAVHGGVNLQSGIYTGSNANNNAIVRQGGYAVWYSGLRDSLTRKRLRARLRKAEFGNLGDVRCVGEGVWEMREFFGPGWRMYYTLRKGVLVVMLCGGDKSTQQADIARAIEIVQHLCEEDLP